LADHVEGRVWNDLYLVGGSVENDVEFEKRKIQVFYVVFVEKDKGERERGKGM